MAHWIIEDEGFGGTVYECSSCGRRWNDLYTKVRLGGDTCPSCGGKMDDDETVYIEKKKNKPAAISLPLPSNMLRRHAEIEEQLAVLHKLTGYTLEELITKFAAGYTLCPPDDDYLLEELEEAIGRINSL